MTTYTEVEYLELPEAAWSPQLKRAVELAAMAAETALELPPDWLDVRVRIPHNPREAKLYADFRRDGEAPRPHVAVKAAGAWSSSAPEQVWVSYGSGGPAETVLDVLHESYHAAKARAGGPPMDEDEEEAAAERFAYDLCPLVYTVCNEEGGL